MDAEKLPTTGKMLPPFRVKRIMAAEGEGVVRMKKDEYDELLRKYPRAALRYIDESDGEVILVGSAFELDQKLAEPVDNAATTLVGVSLELCAAGKTPMHTFDIIKDEEVVNTWRRLDQRTTEEGQKAKKLFFGRQSLVARPQTQTLNVAKEHTPTTQPAIKETSPDLTPPRAKVDALDNSSPVRFGQVTPPKNNLESPQDSQPSSPNASRWAAYSALPGSLSQAPVAVGVFKASKPYATGEDFSEKQKPVSQDTAASVVGAPVPSSTLQVISTPKQKQEHQPLLELFWEQASGNISSQPHLASGDYQPLLSMYEKELSQLGSAAPSSSAITNEPVPQTREPITAVEEKEMHNASTTPATAPLELPTAPEATDPSASPSDLLTHSIQTLLHGVGQLASAFKLTNSELQQQITMAQKEFPHNIEKAFRASIATIESLKLVVPMDKNVAATSLAHRDTQVGHQIPSRTPSQPRPKEDAGAVQTSETVQAKLQSERVDRAVEQMRMCLLNDLKWTPAKIYTRSDVLEDFLGHFKKLQAISLRQTEEQTVSPTPSSGRGGLTGPTRSKDQKRISKTEDHPWAVDITFSKDNMPKDEPALWSEHPAAVSTNGRQPASTSLTETRSSEPKLHRHNPYPPFPLHPSSVLLKYPTGPTPPPRPVRSSKPFAEEEKDWEPRTRPECEKVTPLPQHHSRDLYSKPSQKLSSQLSLPVLQAYNDSGITRFGPPTAPFNIGVAEEMMAGRTRPMRSTGVLRSGSITARADIPRDGKWSHFGNTGLTRSNTVADPITCSSRLRPYDASTYVPTTTISRSVIDEPKAKALNIQKCTVHLVEMGFELGGAEAVAEAVMGDLESAIDVLEEDETARRQVKGKSRAQSMPGAYDEEIYG